MNLVQMATDQVSVQRYLAASSLREARRALWLKLMLLLPVLVIFFATGLVLFAFYQTTGDPIKSGALKKPDQLLPFFVINELPMGLPGLLIAAIYAASMSTISAGINSMTSATIVDFYQRLSASGREASEEKQLALSKWLTLIYGGLVIVLAFQVSKLGPLLEASNKVIGLVGGPLLGLFLLGMLSRRANTPGAVIGWVTGVLVVIPVCFASNISFLWYTLIGLIATFGAGWLVSWLFPAPELRQTDGLVWRDIKERARLADAADALAKREALPQ